MLFLESGTLDLGIVRDSTPNATNDANLFAETFEQVAPVGPESLRSRRRWTPAAWWPANGTWPDGQARL